MTRVYVYLILFSMIACQQPSMNFKMVQQTEQEGILSASGIVKHHDSFYVVSDDAPFLYQLDQNFAITATQPIHNYSDSTGIQRIPKIVKPDFEAMEKVSATEVIIFGSGSKSPERDQLLLLNLEDTTQVKKYTLTPFYTALKAEKRMQGSELNLEAVAYANDDLYLLNRKKNLLFKVNYSQFIKYLETGTALPEITTLAFTLPAIQGIEAGFSGATIFLEENLLLLTASVENTDNAYDDGEILGSFVGKVGLADLHKENAVQWLQIATPSPLKIESVTIDEVMNKNELKLVLTTDSDGGASVFIKGNLSW